MAKVVLAQVLKRKKLTRYRFSKLIGKEYRNTVRYYSPDYDPKFSTLVLWAKVLKIKIRDLFTE